MHEYSAISLQRMKAFHIHNGYSLLYDNTEVVFYCYNKYVFEGKKPSFVLSTIFYSQELSVAGRYRMHVARNLYELKLYVLYIKWPWGWHDRYQNKRLLACLLSEHIIQPIFYCLSDVWKRLLTRTHFRSQVKHTANTQPRS